MRRLPILVLLLTVVLASIYSQAQIAMTTAGEAMKLRSAKPGFMYKDPPPLIVEGWEKARIGTVEYSGAIKTDIYWPAEPSPTPLPVILRVFSYTTEVFIQENGKSFREMEPETIWMAELANRGFIVVCPDIENVGDDMGAILRWIKSDGPGLGADPSRLGFLASSANPKTIPFLLTMPESSGLKAMALYYPELMPASWTAPRNVALHIIKAGKDIPTRNARIDIVANKFRDAGSYVEVITYEKGIHGFDWKERSPEAAAVMMTTLDFFSKYLR